MRLDSQNLKLIPQFIRNLGLLPLMVFLIVAIPTTLCAGCALFFVDGLLDASDPGVMTLALVVLVVFHGVLWKSVRTLMK